jgi:hypothetical protein
MDDPWIVPELLEPLVVHLGFLIAPLPCIGHVTAPRRFIVSGAISMACEINRLAYYSGAIPIAVAAN